MKSTSIASVYFDEATDGVAITFIDIERSPTATIIPTGLWKSSDDSFYWDALIKWSNDRKQYSIRINPVAEETVGSFSNRTNWLYHQHPLIEPVNVIAERQQKPQIAGKIAKPVNYFMFKQKLKYLEHEGKIDWSQFAQAKRMKEMIAHRTKSAEVLSLAQGIMEIGNVWPVTFDNKGSLEKLADELGL